MYGIYANIWGILMVNVTIYIAYMDIHGSYGIVCEVVVKGQELVCFFLQFVCYSFVWRLGKDDLEITLKVVM